MRILLKSLAVAIAVFAAITIPDFIFTLIDYVSEPYRDIIKSGYWWSVATFFICMVVFAIRRK